MIPANELKAWRNELREILDVCAERAALPVTLPHCAICARYATDNLAIEAVLSLLDVMPGELRAEAIAAAADRLTGMPAAMRQQQVDAVTLPVLMDSPGWPLVRSLVIDMADQDICAHFNDPRLAAIDEITLLGFAYGGCKVRPDFADALVNATGFVNVRSIIFHSTVGDSELSRKFWASPLARRLERIDGAPYFGETIAGPLKVREIVLMGHGQPIDGFSFAGLLAEEVTPQLTWLSLGAFSKALQPFLETMARERRLLERVAEVSLFLSDFRGEVAHCLAAAELPASVKQVSWYSQFEKMSQMNLGRCYDHRLVYDRVNEKLNMRFNDKVTFYSAFAFHWDMRSHVSRKVAEFTLVLPDGVDIAEVIRFLDDLPNLRVLSLVYSPRMDEWETLFRSPIIGSLQSFSVYAAEGTPADVPPEWLLKLAFDNKTANVHNLSLFTATFDLTRSPDRVQHLVILNAEAALALPSIKLNRPIELLMLDNSLMIDAAVASALVKSGVLSTAYRLNISGRLTDEAAQILADCSDLRKVRVFVYFHNKPSVDAIRTLLHSPNLVGVWDVNWLLPGPWEKNFPSAEICADSPFLDRVVALDIHGPDKSPLIPRSGRLGRVRRLGEGLTFSVLGDARLATEWRDAPLGVPLKAKVRDYIEWTYRVEHSLDELPELATRLISQSLGDDNAFEEALRALISTAFTGKPVAEKTPFSALNSAQQDALKAVAEVKPNFWNVGALMKRVLLSYGFDFHDREKLCKYIDGDS